MAFKVGDSVKVKDDTTNTKRTVNEVEKNAMGQDVYMIDPPTKSRQAAFLEKDLSAYTSGGKRKSKRLLSRKKSLKRSRKSKRRHSRR